ncbi:MscS family membrane protein [Methylohalomonas lacus]|uniref:MscS family membrane protein n=1 Tax=Methylohalomonas lacus TaxID=398773 RepID=A0AAE3L1F0_9GAMM|nr:mechanosensitive ion channel family protein [Methylohalomonas lacus]MCS3903924.1 MscS family membrane protein [Methylohalomonas lacus]
MNELWQQFKPFMVETSKLLNTDPWIIQVFIVVLLTVTVSFFERRFLEMLHKRLGRTDTQWDDALVSALYKPLSLLIYVIGLGFAMDIIFKETDAEIFSAVGPVRDVLVVFCVAWFATRFVTRAAENYINSRHTRGDYYDRTAVDAIAKLLRISIIITAGLVVLQTLGYSISGVLAFGGIGGIAVGFAAKDMLANFFGGMMVYLDRPFSVGDWVRSPDRDIEGTVEEIGWRLTRIRTFDKRPLYVPNYVFNQVALENPSRMLNRRIKETVGLRYDDAAKVGTIAAAIREMINNHEDIDTDQTMIVNFDTFADSSLNIMVYTFTKTCNWIEYHRVKEDVLLKIIDIVEQHGAECAFPTTTLHVPEPVHVDADDRTQSQSRDDNAGGAAQNRQATSRRDASSDASSKPSQEVTYGDMDGEGE